MFLAVIVGAILGVAIIGKQYEKHCMVISKKADWLSDLSVMQTRWLWLLQNGKTVADYCNNNGYRRVAIYGMSEIGYALLDELKSGGVEIPYCIDRNADSIFAKVDVKRPDEVPDEADVVIVAVIQYYDSVKNTLEKRVTCPIVSLADIVWEA